MKAMRTMFVCFVLLCGAAVLGARDYEWQWSVKAGGTGDDGGRSIAIDSQGNQYVTGFFYGTATFGSHTIKASGNGDIFAAKLDPSGNWLWAVKAGGTDSNYGMGIALDAVGNTYVTGGFSGTITFGNHTLTESRNQWDPDIFVAKLDPDGNWLWAVQAGGTGYDEGDGIALDGSGNAYVSGNFSGTATFGSHTLTVSGGEWDPDIFAAKLDPCGNWLWAVKAGGIHEDYGRGFAVDGSGKAYVTGLFEGKATFGSHTLTASGGEDIFAAKLDPDGNWLWAVKAGGTARDEGCDIALDGSGNAYVSGNFSGTATFGSHTLTVSGGEWDIFAAKLDPAGNWLWAINAGGEFIDNGMGIAVDGVGNAYVTGYFQNTATFGSHTLYSSSDIDIFVAKLYPSGNWFWAVKAGGTDDAVGDGIALDGSGNAYVTGDYQGTTTFGSHTLISSGWRDIFVAKLGNGTAVEVDLAP